MMRHVAANGLTLIIVVLVVIFGIIGWCQSQYHARGPLEAPLIFEVPRGAGLATVSQELADKGAISSESLFRIGARYSGAETGLKFGEYEIPAGASMAEILALLNEGANVLRQIVVPEGWTSWQVVEMLKANPELTGDIAALPPEGSLAPAGYDFQKGDDRNAILDRMREEQQALLAAAWADRAADLPLRSPDELLTLASIVEKETGIPEERPEVAGVFVNRLRQGMRLQTDPTVIYGITEGRGPLGRGLRASELATRTPYNTYVIQGLPPTPIANPGREALAAAANPPATESLYFVADGSGGHAFAATLQQHNANVAAWRRLEAERARAAEEAEPSGDVQEPGADQ